MLPDRAYEDHYPQLQSIVSKILAKHSSNFADLFAHEKFMPFIDMFQKESVKVSASEILRLFLVWNGNTWCNVMKLYAHRGANA